MKINDSILAQSAVQNAASEQASQRLSAKMESLSEMSTEDWTEEQRKKLESQFEEVFLHFLWQQMQKTTTGAGLFGSGAGSEMYQTMFDQAVSQLASEQRPLGIGRLMTARMGGQSKTGVSTRHTSALMDAISSYESDHPGLSWPLLGPISSEYGLRSDPFTGKEKFHHGLDIAAREGTPVRAPLAGKVVFAGKKGGYGLTTVVDHGNGLTSLYAHQKSIKLKEGDTVRRGDILGKCGSSGRSTGPHLHFEIRQDGKSVDPMTMLKNRMNLKQ